MFILPAPSPVAFNFFSIPIYYYGIILAFAIFVAIIVANKYFNKVNSRSLNDFIIESSIFIIFSGIFGARLYYCLLNFSYYWQNPLEIVDIRQGGLSIHGAIIGGVICLRIIAYKKKISVLKVLDAISTATLLGQSLGRWGNYFNSEAYGFPIPSQQWGVLIPESRRLPEFMNYSLYHPTFLYESILDFIAFLVLSYLFFKYNKYSGLSFFVYLILYSLIRFFVEQIRIDSALDIGTVHIAEVVSVLLFIIGIIGVCYSLFKCHLKKS